jgi:hypothetical protein
LSCLYDTGQDGLGAASVSRLIAEVVQQVGIGKGGERGPQVLGRVHGGAFGATELFEVVGQPVARRPDLDGLRSRTGPN